jgi:O-antigen/teichoic acid export membrane protein
MDSKEQRIVLTDFFVKVGRIQYLLMALLASGVVFFGKPFIKYWAGEGYDDAYYIAIIMILPSIISLTQNIGIEIQRAENRHHYRSYIYGLMALGNLLLSIYLCQIWGGIGSAIGTSVACIGATIIAMNIVYYKKINIDVKQYWKNIAKQTLGMIIPFVIGALIMKFVAIDNMLKLAVWIVIYTIVYLIFVVFLSTNDYEKELIKSVLRKIKLIK